MCAVKTRLSSIGLYVLATLTLLSVQPSREASKPVVQPQTADATAALSPEVRLRKLHLVRPDLIPYPIQLEIYC